MTLFSLNENKKLSIISYNKCMDNNYYISKIKAKIWLGFKKDYICLKIDMYIVLKETTKEVIIRLNNGLDITKCSSYFEKLDLLKNGYKIIFKNNKIKGENIKISFHIKGNPILRFQNKLQQQVFLRGENFIIPYSNYIPKDKYNYEIDYIYPKSNNTIACANIIKKDFENLRYNIIKTKCYYNLGNPIISLDKWFTKYYYENNITLMIYYKNCSTNTLLIGHQFFSILKRPEFYFDKIPFRNIAIIFEEDSQICFNQGNTIYINSVNKKILTHEIAHLWGGNIISFKQLGFTWFYESFATFFEYYLEISMYSRNNIYDELYVIDRLSKKFPLLLKITDYQIINNVFFGNNIEFINQGVVKLIDFIIKNGLSSFLDITKKLIEKYNFKQIDMKDLEKIYNYKFFKQGVNNEHY